MRLIKEPSYWRGVRVRPRRSAVETKTLDCAYPMGYHTRFFDLVQPAFSQRLPDCVIQASACVIEIEYKLRGHGMASDEQLSTVAWFRAAREMYWRDEPWDQGGLLLDQGFKAAIELGILPQGTRIRDADADAETIDAVLDHHPMIQAHFVTAGWFDTNPRDGEIRPGATIRGDAGLHATCLVGTQVDGEKYWLVGQNSWGANYGWRGYVTMSCREWCRLHCGNGPYWIEIPKGPWRIPDAFICRGKNLWREAI